MTRKDVASTAYVSSWTKKNQSIRSSAHAHKQNHTGKRGIRMPIAGFTSDSEPKCTHTGNQMPLDGLIPDSKHTTRGYGMPIAGLTSIS